MTQKAASAAFFMPTSRITSLGLTFFTLSWLAFNHYRPWINFHAELLAFIALFAFLVGVLFEHRKYATTLPRISLWLSLTVTLPWLQYASGINFFAGDALLSSLYFFGFLAAVFVGYNFARATHPNPSFIGLMHALWIVAMLSAAIGLAQWLHLDGALGMYVVQSDVGDRAMGNLGQPNQLATLLLMGMAAYAYVFERRVIGGFTFALGVGFMTGVLVLTQSRAGMLSVLVVAVYLLWRKRSIQSRLTSKAVATWIVCFWLATWVLPYLSELLLQADVRSIRSAEPINQRLRMWQQVAYAIAQAPWFGFGWNQTPAAHAAGAIAYPGSIPYNYAHNFVVDMLAWNGLPLGLLLTGGIVYWFIARLRSTKRLDGVHAMACLLPLAVHSMLEYPFAYAYFLITAGFMVGAVEAAQLPAKTMLVNRRWLLALLALWGPVGIYLTYEYFLIEEDFRIVRFENLNIGKTPAAYEVPQVWMISHMAAMLKARRVVIEPNMQAADLENMRRVSQRFSDNVPHCRYAMALAINNDPVGAVHQFALIKGMYGAAYQTACLRELKRLQIEKFPRSAALPSFN